MFRVYDVENRKEIKRVDSICAARDIRANYCFAHNNIERSKKEKNYKIHHCRVDFYGNEYWTDWV